MSLQDRGHAEGCWTETWNDMVYQADQIGEPVPEEVRRLAREDNFAGIVRCADGCPVLERAIERGRELAAIYGW